MDGKGEGMFIRHPGLVELYDALVYNSISAFARVCALPGSERYPFRVSCVAFA